MDNKMQYINRRIRAFTLLELFLVISLAVMVAVPISMAIFANFRSTAIGTVVNGIAAMAKKGRYMSIEYNMPVYLTFDAGNGEVFLEWDSAGEATGQRSLLEQGTRLQLPDDISIKSITINGMANMAEPKTVFRPNGTGDFATITLSAAGEEHNLVLTPLAGELIGTDSVQTRLVINLDSPEYSGIAVFK